MFRWVFQSLTWFHLLLACCADIRIGGAINIFQNFGDLGSVVKVDPHLDANWFYDHDSVDVFEEVLETRSPSPTTGDEAFNGDFHLELCDSLTQLKAAYFKSYMIERSEKPWRVFTGSWSTAGTARHLGINSSYVTGAHGYVLVRLTRNHELVSLTPHLGLRLNTWTAERTSRLVPGEVNSVLEFIRISGSHYVHAYTTGDSLYQVFVFSPTVYTELQKVMREYELSSAGLDRVLSFFTPWHVEHMGRIMSTSKNSSLEQWAAQNLQSRVFMFIYSSLLNLHSAPELLHDFDYLLGNDALLSVDLKSLAPLFPEDTKRLWFEEVLDNHLKLWELNV